VSLLAVAELPAEEEPERALLASVREDVLRFARESFSAGSSCWRSFLPKSENIPTFSFVEYVGTTRSR
jgi:hypothetical protein